MMQLFPVIRPLPLLAVVACASGALFACSGDKKDAVSPQAGASASAAYNAPPPGGYPPGSYPPPNTGAYPQGGYPPPNTGAYPQGGYPPPAGTVAPAPTGSGVPGLGGVPVDPNLLAQIAAAGAAVMGGGVIPAGDPIEAGIKAEAAKSAPGMQPEGASVKDTLAADGHRSLLVTLQGGKCYTFVAFSPAGQVTAVDLHLLLPPLYILEAGKDDANRNVAVIGRGTNPLCPVAPFAVQYKLDVHAKAGQGLIGLQMFSKTK
jgi:hypothetical protein